jgi:hypothetical protein
MTRRGRRDTRMSVTLMEDSSARGARRPSQPPVALTSSHMIVALHDRRLAVLTIVVEGCGVVVVPSLAGEEATVDF